MGSIASSRRDRDDRVLVDALRGRCLDLPGGGDLYVFGNAGAGRGAFASLDASFSVELSALGRARLRDCEREFLVLRGADGVIYGRERGSGLHVLASTMHELLCRVGLSQRDMNVLDGRFEDRGRRQTSPPRCGGRRPLSDTRLNKSRGVCVDRRAGGARGTGGEPPHARRESRLQGRDAIYYVDTCGDAAARRESSRRGGVAAGRRRPSESSERRAAAGAPDNGGFRVRFGSAVVVGGDTYRSSGRCGSDESAGRGSVVSSIENFLRASAARCSNVFDRRRRGGTDAATPPAARTQSEDDYTFHALMVTLEDGGGPRGGCGSAPTARKRYPPLAAASERRPSTSACFEERSVDCVSSPAPLGTSSRDDGYDYCEPYDVVPGVKRVDPISGWRPASPAIAQGHESDYSEAEWADGEARPVMF